MSTVEIDALVSVVQNTVKTMFNLDARMVEQRAESNPVAPFEVSAIIGITGHIKGSLVMSFPMSLARWVTGAMLGETDLESIAEPDISDCIGEVANIVAGNLLPMVSEDTDGDKRLSLPSCVVGQHRVVWGTKDAPCDLLVFGTDLGLFAAETNLREEGPVA